VRKKKYSQISSKRAFHEEGFWSYFCKIATVSFLGGVFIAGIAAIFEIICFVFKKLFS
jgi:hypothetical protein